MRLLALPVSFPPLAPFVNNLKKGKTHKLLINHCTSKQAQTAHGLVKGTLRQHCRILLLLKPYASQARLQLGGRGRERVRKNRLQLRSISKDNSIKNKERQWRGTRLPRIFCRCVSLSRAAPTLLLPQGNSVFCAAVSLKPHSRLNMTCQWYSKTFSNLVLLQSCLSVDLEEWAFNVILTTFRGE